MITYSNWHVDESKVLTRSELAAVLAELRPRAERFVNDRINLTVLRLACCCGLRACEIAGLRVRDVVTDTARPHVYVRPDSAKNGRQRRVPLWWDEGTLADLAAWRAFRRRDNQAALDDPFLVTTRPPNPGRAMNRHLLRQRFLTACRVLGNDRVRTLTIHHGRHTFVSHALAGGRTLAEVRAAAGHSSLITTSVYLHIAVEDDGEVGALFNYHQ